MKTFVFAALTTALTLTAFTAEARRLQLVEGGVVKEIEYGGSCDDAYAEFPGQVYACTTLSIANPRGNTDDLNGKAERDILSTIVPGRGNVVEDECGNSCTTHKFFKLR